MHKCNKEVELQKIADDIGYIKKALAGNGEAGLITEVSSNSKFRIGHEATSRLTKTLLGSGWLATAIIAASQIYINLHGG